MIRSLFLAGLFIIQFTAFAQYASKHGRFQVDQIRGCVPFTINITNTNLNGAGGCTAGTPCNMNFDGSGSCPPNATCSNVLQFKYNTAGTYLLIVTYPSSALQFGKDTVVVTVDPDIKPAFDIYSCAGSKVEVNITDKTYDTYYIDFKNDGTIDKTLNKGINQTAVYSFGAPGTYSISVKGQKFNAANNCSANVQTGFQAITTLPLPTINTLTATDASTLQLNFTPANNIEYKGEIAINNASNYQVYGTLYGVNSLTVPNLSVKSNFYCLRLNTFDPCANTNQYTTQICSQKLSVTPASGVNQVAWQTSSAGISTIKVNRNGTTIKTAAATDTSYPDNTVVCKNKYQYQLVATYTNGAVSTSLPSDSIKAILNVTPAGIKNTSAVVDAPKVDLKWIQDPAYTAGSYTILRGPKNSNSFSPIGNSATPTFTDEAYNNAGYCYQINYTDNCDNVSANGLPACPMLLSGAPDPDNNVNLDWSAYKGWSGGVASYRLYRGYQSGQATQVVYTGPDSVGLDDKVDPTKQVVYYKVVATANEAGVTQSISNELRVVRNINLYYPTAFNPDSKVSALNRTFAVRGHFIESMKLQIFDRWGALVFYSDNNEAWDGKREGLAMPDATYVWTADGTDLSGNSFKKSGTVVLLRK